MTRFFAALLTAVALPGLAFSQHILTLDKAIAESMDYFAEKLPSNARVAVLKVEAINGDLTDYISVECENYIKDNTPLIQASKKGLAAILKQKNIDDINRSNEDEVLNVARALGADAAIFVEFSRHGENYRFFAQAFDAKTAQIRGMQSLRVGLDGLLADFIGEKYVAPAANKADNGEELASVKKELEEIKALLAAQLQQSSVDNSRDETRARLESDMEEKSRQSAPKVSFVGNEGIGAHEQLVILDASGAECFLDVYFDGEFIARMNAETAQPFVLKKGAHTVIAAKVKPKGGIWKTIQAKTASFVLSDHAVRLEISTYGGRLGNVDVEKEKSPQNYLHQYKILRVNTGASAGR